MKSNILQSQKKPLELLAPAGSIEALRAAVASGANAVYCGLNQFSARAKAVNFDIDSIGGAIEYAHLFGVKIYVAMNTLLYQNELATALDIAKKLYAMDVDALIIQDLGFAVLLKKELPALMLHASTQMGIHNLEGVVAAKKLGIDRVILSRETTLADIKSIRDNCDIELEFFCHGALCVGFSGNCYLCSILMRQSGNRGRCLQLCRKQYSLSGKKEYGTGYWLSAKDLNMSSCLKQLADAGVSSFKIEGRMRRPGYVATAVKTYRKIIDNSFIVTHNDTGALNSVYVRGGGTQAHLFLPGANTICDIKEGHTGAPAADESMLFNPKLKINLECIINPEEHVRLVLRCKDTVVAVSGSKAERSVSAPLCADTIKRSLSKTGDTPFDADKIDIALSNSFLPISALNDLRRKGVDALKTTLLKNYLVLPSGLKNTLFNQSYQSSPAKSFRHIVMVDSFEKFKLVQHGVDCVIYSPFIYDKHDIEKFIDSVSLPVYLNLPIVSRHNDMTVLHDILSSSKVKGIVANNLYALELGKDKNIMLGLGLNLINNILSAKRILSLESKGEFKSDDIVYAFGFPSLMTFCHCINKTVSNAASACVDACIRCNGDDFILTDEKNARFKIKRIKIANCYHQLFNNLAVNAVDILRQKNASCGLLYDFCAVDMSELKKFDYNNLNNFKPCFTRGHLYRGVE